MTHDGERSFGGYTYHQRLAVGLFGEVWRGLSGSGGEARILHLDPRLSALPAFTLALTRFAEGMAALDHPRVVAVRQVGKSGDDVIVVTDAVAGAVTLEDLIARTPAALPSDIALAIGIGAIEGLAHAHSLGVVHGALHPRSVVIDFHGGVKVNDFGVAWALATTASGQRDGALFSGLRGYLAPELAMGDPAGVPCDVYAAGALLHHLMCGTPPPGPWTARTSDGRATAALKRVVERAMSISPSSRLVNGTEVEELVEEAIVSDGLRAAPPDEVARFVTDRLASPAQSAGEDQLDKATQDLLADLDLPMHTRTKPGQGTPRTATDGAAPRRRGVTDVLAGLDKEGDVHEELTEVDGATLGAAPDPISQILRMNKAGGLAAPAPNAADTEADAGATPLPEPLPHVPGSVTRHRKDLEGEPSPSRPSVPSARQPAGRRRKAQQVDPLGRTGPLSSMQGAPVAHAAIGPSPIDVPDAPEPRRGRGFLWLALTVFALAGLGAVLYTQTDLFDPGRKSAAARADQRARDDELARHAAAQPVPVDLTITSSEPEAAVWLLLGRTPLDTFPLSSAMVHELRFEHEGYQPVDLRVTGYQWKGETGTQSAEVSATLVAGSERASAFPPAPSGPAPPGPRGRGVVHVTSQPAGAQVWLLIGFTPTATITGLEAGHDVEVKVLKDGYRPGFAAIRADEWYLAGKSGPVHERLSRDVELTKVAKKPPKSGNRPR